MARLAWRGPDSAGRSFPGALGSPWDLLSPCGDCQGVTSQGWPRVFWHLPHAFRPPSPMSLLDADATHVQDTKSTEFSSLRWGRGAGREDHAPLPGFSGTSGCAPQEMSQRTTVTITTEHFCTPKSLPLWLGCARPQFPLAKRGGQSEGATRRPGITPHFLRVSRKLENFPCLLCNNAVLGIETLSGSCGGKP